MLEFKGVSHPFTRDEILSGTGFRMGQEKAHYLQSSDDLDKFLLSKPEFGIHNDRFFKMPKYTGKHSSLSNSKGMFND